MNMYNNNYNTVQVRKGKTLAKLVNLEMRGRDKAEDKAGGRTKEQELEHFL